MKIVKFIAYILLVIGGLNWGIIGLTDTNVLAMLFGGSVIIERIAYILIGLSAISALCCCKKSCGTSSCSK